MKINLALSLLLFLEALGCRSTFTEYDLSTTAPFSAYSNRRVELQKPMILLKDAGGQFELHAMNPQDRQTGLVLNPGYKVSVRDTRLCFGKQSFMSGGLRLAYGYTYVSIDVDRDGWPQTVRTFIKSINYTSAIGERIEVERSPWEPIDTLPKRSIPWPSDQLIVQGETHCP